MTETVDRVTVLCDDRFDEDRPSGSVVGSVATDGSLRLGADVEGVVGVDNGALRLRPLETPGWGRAGIAYGPYTRRAGLALSVRALNGHNASQTYYIADRGVERVRRWLGDVRRGRFRRPRHHENFAVGWFPTPVPAAPERSGNGFVMHAATADNGELWVGVDGRPLRAVRGVQNVEVLYVVVLRDRGAAYYVASLPGSYGLGGHPTMRPVGIDSRASDTAVYAGVQQRILGEVGYRVDTRVGHVRVADVPELAAWYGTAALADDLCGSGTIGGSSAATGGTWVEDGCDLVRTPAGATASRTADSTCIADAGGRVGLVHAIVDAGRRGAAGVVFRADADGAAGFSVVVGSAGTELAVRTGDGWEQIAHSDRWRARPGVPASLQVVDDGERFGVHLDGQLVFDRWFDDDRNTHATAVGIRAAAGFDGTIRALEAHPLAVAIPAELDLGAPWSRTGDVVAIDDDLRGDGGDLDRSSAGGGVRWTRSEGAGRIVRTVHGGQVDADLDRPNPGRTIYTVPWADPRFADASIQVSHPGTRAGEGHAGRGGIVLWEDEANYVVVNLFLDDTFDGASISTFYRLDGREVMYDAVWTLVPGVTYGGRNELRVAFDGLQLLAWLDGRPSLHRALTDVYPDARRIDIRRIGLIVNWEWGDDTGSVFRSFVARRDDDRGAR